MKMKKILAMLLVAAMAVSLAACQTKTMSEDESVVESESIVESESVVESESTPAEDEVVDPVESETTAEPVETIDKETVTYDSDNVYGMTVDENGALHYPRSADNTYTVDMLFEKELPSGAITLIPDNGVEVSFGTTIAGNDPSQFYSGAINIWVPINATGNFTLTMNDTNGVEIASWDVIIDG